MHRRTPLSSEEPGKFAKNGFGVVCHKEICTQTQIAQHFPFRDRRTLNIQRTTNSSEVQRGGQTVTSAGNNTSRESSHVPTIFSIKADDWDAGRLAGSFFYKNCPVSWLRSGGGARSCSRVLQFLRAIQTTLHVKNRSAHRQVQMPWRPSSARIELCRSREPAYKESLSLQGGDPLGGACCSGLGWTSREATSCSMPGWRPRAAARCSGPDRWTPRTATRCSRPAADRGFQSKTALRGDSCDLAGGKFRLQLSEYLLCSTALFYHFRFYRAIFSVRRLHSLASALFQHVRLHSEWAVCEFHLRTAHSIEYRQGRMGFRFTSSSPRPVPLEKTRTGIRSISCGEHAPCLPRVLVYFFPRASTSCDAATTSFRGSLIKKSEENPELPLTYRTAVAC